MLAKTFIYTLANQFIREVFVGPASLPVLLVFTHDDCFLVVYLSFSFRGDFFLFLSHLGLFGVFTLALYYKGKTLL